MEGSNVLQWRIDREIGSGSYAKVYCVTHSESNMKVNHSALFLSFF